MDYLRIYNELIETRRVRGKIEGVYGEWHHVKPRCMGGGDEPENLVWLTGREHCIAHLLLAFAYGGKLWFAATAMGLIVGGRKGECARLIAIARKKAAEANSGLDHPLSDKTIYDFRDTRTDEILSCTRVELAQMYGLRNVDTYMLVSGRVLVTKGISLASTVLKPKKQKREPLNTRKRNVVYAWRQIGTEQIIIATREEMRDLYGLPWKKSRHLVIGKYKNCKGYEYIGKVINGQVQEDQELKERKLRPKPKIVKDSVYTWVRLDTGEVFVRTRIQMLEEFGIPLWSTNSLINGHKKSAHGFCLQGENYKNNSKDHQIYTVRRISTGELLDVTREQMMKELGLTRGQATNLTQKIAYNNGGYCLADVDPPPEDLWWPDKTVYTFQVVKTGELLFKTRKQMFDEFGFTSQQITNLKSGYIKSSKGIRLLKEVPFDTSVGITIPQC